MSIRSGFVIIDKPRGVTSFSMVSLVRRLSGVRRVGHAGTLDPLATGVLPVAIGPAARLIEYLDGEPKTYVARLRFGITTDTYDAEGEVTSSRDASGVREEDVRQVLPEFIGDIEQKPPLYSALKVAGKPLYRYAREGADVEVQPRRVHIDSIELLTFGGTEAEIEVRCGKGTYIRSLAHDVGERLRCGAHLAELRRTESGGFRIDDAFSPRELESLVADERLEDAVLAPDRALERRPAAIFASPHVEDVRRGRDVEMAGPEGVEICRAYSIRGEFLGVLKHAGRGVWHPEKVLPEG